MKIKEGGGMGILNNSIVTDADTEVLDSQITQISNDFSETHYFDSEQEEELELLVAKAMKLGELYERKKWQAAKAQAAPEGFVVVSKEPTDKTIAHMINTPIEVNLLCDHADTFLSEGEAYIAYQAMVEAQEPAK